MNSSGLKRYNDSTARCPSYDKLMMDLIATKARFQSVEDMLRVQGFMSPPTLVHISNQSSRLASYHFSQFRPRALHLDGTTPGGSTITDHHSSV